MNLAVGAMSAVTVATTAATSATTSASATSATATTTAVPTASAASAASRLTLAGFVDGEGAAVERFAIELLDRGLRVLVVRKLDKGEPTRLTGHAIGHDADADDFTAAGGASFAERSFVRVIRKIPYVDASSHASALPVRFGLPLRSFPGDE
jgi:hypothetical protein